MAKTIWNNFKIKAEFRQEKASPLWGEWNAERHNRIKVTNLDTGIKVSFDYWGPREGVQTRAELLEAFRCFLSDGLDAEMTLTDFAAEFGYLDDVGKAVTVYKACKKSLKKITRLFGDTTEGRNKAYDTLNELIDLDNNGYEEG